MGVDTDELAAIEAAMQAAARTILPQPSFDDDVMLIVPKQQPASKSKKAEKSLCKKQNFRRPLE